MRRLLVLSALALVPASPAGAVVVFQRPATNAIVVAADDGSSPRVVAHGLGPRVSPDGRRIVYVRGRTVRMVGIDGRVRRTLVRRASGAPPAWSPDGRWLAVGADGARGRIFDRRGRLVRSVRLWDVEADEFDRTTFSPDGSRLLIQTSIGVTAPAVFSLRVPGGRLREEGFSELPVWGRGGLATRYDDGSRYDPGTYTAISYRPSLRSNRSREILRGPAESSLSPVDWSERGRRLLIADGRPGQPGALRIDFSTGAYRAFPVPMVPASLSRDGSEVLGLIDGDVVSQTLDGTVRVIARDAVAPSWTR